MGRNRHGSRTYRSLIRLAAVLEEVVVEQRCEDLPDDELMVMFRDIIADRTSFFEDRGRNRQLLKAARVLLGKLGGATPSAEEQKVIDQIDATVKNMNTKLKQIL